jgi:hypothetical protein
VSSMPLQLYALTWSLDDTKAIQDWAEQNADQVMIAGSSRILFEQLHVAVSDPNIFSMAIDGVVIRDHTKASPGSLSETLKKLNSGTLKLYSTVNGLEPVTSATSSI